MSDAPAGPRGGVPCGAYRQLKGPLDHAEALHAGGGGRVTIARRIGGRWRETPVAVADLATAVAELAGADDAFISQARFRCYRRTVEGLFELGALYTDLDYHRTAFAGRPPQQVLEAALIALDDAGLPPPSFAVATGRGLALVWLHEPVPRAALPRWRACQARLLDALRPLGADPLATDAARVLRLIGSRNPRVGRPVEALTPAGAPWPFDALAEEILPLRRAEVVALRVERARRRAERRLIVPPARRLTAATLWEGRLSELQRLRRHRWPGGAIPSGQRDAWIFTASIAVSWLVPPRCLERELLALAEEASGWSAAEARSRLHAVLKRAAAAARGERVEWQGRAVDLRYRLRDATIVEWLGITEAEARALNLRHICPPELKRERRRSTEAVRRRAAGARPRDVYEAASLERTRPWQAEGISRRTWFHRRAREQQAQQGGTGRAFDKALPPYTAMDLCKEEDR